MLSLLSQTQMMMIIMSLIALKHDLIRRCTQWDVFFACYEDAEIRVERLHAMSSLLFMNVKTVITFSCINFLQRLQTKRRLNRLILNETHLLLIVAHYRESLTLLATLRRVQCSFMCLIVMLSLSAELKLRQSLNFINAETLRASSDRLNLQYLIRRMSKRRSVNESLIEETARICNENLKRWRSIVDDFTKSTARDVCFVRFKIVEHALINRLESLFYHEELSL